MAGSLNLTEQHCIRSLNFACYLETLGQQVIKLKKQEFKTEPAFATALGIEGDPYWELRKPTY
jgi:hypothetical protein